MLALQIIARRSLRQRRIEAAHGQEGVTEAEWVFGLPCPEWPATPEGGQYAPGALQTAHARLSAWKKQLGSYAGYRPDLRGINLQSADLTRMDLRGLVLAGAEMQGAWSFNAAQMQGAWLIMAQMQGAALHQARMQGAFLQRARMQGASLPRAQMQAASLDRAQMQGSVLDGAQMQGASLDTTQMQGASLLRAQMQGASLDTTQMHGSKLVLTVDVAGAALRNLDFSDLPVTPEQISAAFGDASVRLPFPPPAHWPAWKLDWQTYLSQLAKFRRDPAAYRPPEPPLQPDPGPAT